MATGLPVIAMACGGPEELVTPASGALVPPRDPEALAREMQGLVDAYDTFNPAAIHRYAVEQFGTRAVAARLVAIYRQATAATS